MRQRWSVVWATGVAILMSQIRAYSSRTMDPGMVVPRRESPNVRRGKELSMQASPRHGPHRGLAALPRSPGFLGPAVRFSTVGGVMQDISFLGSFD
jgi:hypothetical protein